MEELDYWIWFSLIKSIGSIKKQKLLDKYNSPKEIWKLSKDELLKIEGIGEKISNEILDNEKRKNIEKIKKRMKEENIKLITIKDKEYPEKLKEIYDKPICLYAKGNIKLLNEFSLAIIGCRKNSEYGKTVTKAVTKAVVQKNMTTISGLAKGIDSICHKETTNFKGKTIAVIGSGLDVIYPRENKGLVEEILTNEGLIISEYPLGEEPKKINFPARNRIISGLSNGVIVIEAKLKSGTMTTVDFALEQGKTVFAIPGNITNINSQGTNELIKQGAKCVTCMQDILEEYNFI